MNYTGERMYNFLNRKGLFKPRCSGVLVFLNGLLYAQTKLSIL